MSPESLYVPRKLSVPAGLIDVVDTEVSLRVIKQQWDEFVQIAASIETGTSAVIAPARFRRNVLEQYAPRCEWTAPDETRS